MYINHTPKAIANPNHGDFILKAAKKPMTTTILITKNKITFLITLRLDKQKQI